MPAQGQNTAGSSTAKQMLKPSFAVGYAEVWAGKPGDFDRYGTGERFAYERGRQFAAYLKGRRPGPLPIHAKGGQVARLEAYRILKQLFKEKVIR